MKPKPLSSLNHLTVPVAMCDPSYVCELRTRETLVGATTAGAEHYLCRTGCPALTKTTLPVAARRERLSAPCDPGRQTAGTSAGGAVADFVWLVISLFFDWT